MKQITKTFIEPTERRYEDRYGQYLEFFKDIAERPQDEYITIANAPWCWVPLLIYLQCKILRPVYRFPHCNLVWRMLWMSQSAATGEVATSLIDRTAVEVLCGFRPECVDALYKIDTEWNVPHGRTILVSVDREFIVTNNGSFHRREVMDFIKKLKSYTPSKRKVVLVPCAADKPYPAPLHQAVLDILPNDFYLAIATGVLGIVPQDMWREMPLYDSGIPNQWRLFELAQEYFERVRHDRIVIYCDFYAHVLEHAFSSIPGYMKFMRAVNSVLPPVKYADYVDLLSPENLGKLKQALEQET